MENTTTECHAPVPSTTHYVLLACMQESEPVTSNQSYARLPPSESVCSEKAQ